MYKSLANNGINYQPHLVIAGFLNHQQYVWSKVISSQNLKALKTEKPWFSNHFFYTKKNGFQFSGSICSSCYSCFFFPRCCFLMFFSLYGCFLKWWVLPQIIHFNRVFHYFHHPFWGPPIFGNTHINSPVFQPIGSTFSCRCVAANCASNSSKQNVGGTHRGRKVRLEPLW